MMRRVFLLATVAFVAMWLVAMSEYAGVVFWSLCVVAVGGVVAHCVARRRRRARLTAYGPELRSAMATLSNKRRWADLAEVLGLFVDADLSRSPLGRGGAAIVGLQRDARRPVRYIPSVRGIRAAVYGADVAVQGAPGHSLELWSWRCGQLASALLVPQVRVREPRPGIFEVQLRVRDPLRDPIVLSEPIITESGFDLPVGVDELGAGVYLQCRNQSGVVVGGLPGSGKSAWVSFAVSSLAERSDVQWLLIDGKGGHDLEALSPRAYRYLSADEACDLEYVRDALRSVHTLMKERLKNEE
jgi:hypothetical protein